MLEIVVICLFAAMLLLCIALGVSIIVALILGYFLFCAYGLFKGHSVRQLLKMSLSGLYTVRNIIITFVLIGVMTAVWRACGTIPYIIYHSSKVIMPSIFVLITFLLCCLISVLTGTAFGSAATVGVICMSIANAMGISPLYIGGAILSGIFVGDRCSPMSTSALLVCELTHTDIYTNIRLMVKTSIVPFILTCAFYLAIGLGQGGGGASADIWELFADNFNLVFVVALPAVAIVVMSLLRIKVRKAMVVSIVLGCVICLAVQHTPPLELARLAVLGYKTPNAQLAPMMDGGGIFSMARTIAVICLSSSFAGIFEGTRLLDGLKARLQRLAEQASPYACAVVTSALTSMIACNQTLATMLTHQLCKGTQPDGQLAIDMENTVIVISALVPWSIAGTTPLATVGAPLAAIAFAAYLYILPLWNYIISVRDKRRSAAEAAK